MTVYSYSVVRDLESGGSVGVCLSSAGNLFYGRPFTKFVHKMDAESFMARAKRDLPTEQGQLGFRVIEQEVK